MYYFKPLGKHWYWAVGFDRSPGYFCVELGLFQVSWMETVGWHFGWNKD